MSFQVVIEPIDRWPLPDTKPRKPAQFRASYANTLTLLKRELTEIGARGAVVIQIVTANGYDDLRRDGMLRAGAKATHPGVRISFESKHGPLTYSTDVFEYRYAGDPPDWQANLRAIALGLEALRAVDRYGISRSGEQYRGWRQLEAGTGAVATSMTIEAALALIAHEAGDEVALNSELFTAQLRRAKANAHPDRNNGDRSRWDAVEQAARVLRRAGRLA